MPPAIYHSPAILDLEIEQIFHRDWMCLGRTAEIPRPGDFVCRDIVDAPVFAIRQGDASVKAFANVCVHRSSRLLSGAGHASRISCPYHSWTYDLAGQLIGAPFMDETPGFDVADFRIRELACGTWQGFILHRVHRNSFGKYGTSEDRTVLFPGEEAFTYHYVQEDEASHSVFAHPENTWLQGADRFRTFLVTIFPAHVMQLQPDLLWYLSILPQGPGKVNIRWAVSIPAEILDSAVDRQGTIDEVMTFLHQVNDEDRPIVENVFRSTASPGAAPGPLSFLERNVWEFGRYLARSLSERL